MTEQEILNHINEYLRYDDSTGDFFWKKNPGSRVRFDKPAGTVIRGGYRRISIKKKFYLAHRLVWLFKHGKFPDSMLDHVNLNKLDNRIENLRECNNSQNQINTGLLKTNTSGYRGVSFEKASQKWLSAIKVNKKRIIIGRFDKKEDAAIAYAKTSKSLFGEFSRVAA